VSNNLDIVAQASTRSIRFCSAGQLEFGIQPVQNGGLTQGRVERFAQIGANVSKNESKREYGEG